MKSIKRDIDRHINDVVVESYNRSFVMSINKKIQPMSKLRAKREFGHFIGQGFIEAAKHYFEFYFKF